MIQALVVLWIGWFAFIFAIVNIANTVFGYILGKDDSTGLLAIIRLAIFAGALTAWYYLVFYKAPLLLN